MARIRLDVLLVERGLAESRERAKRDILAGWVKVNGETIRTVAKTVTGCENITVERPKGLFVSRGGVKLARALSVFGINVSGVAACDLGASTGGFTDCLLKAGAAHVDAVDVGYGQLDYSLRADPRVTVRERTHVNSLKAEDFLVPVAFVSIDLSFISLTKVMSHVCQLFPHAEGVALVKPQFEAAAGELKKGVVRREKDHAAILARTLAALVGEGCVIKGLCPSPIKGPAGNIEFLLHFSFAGEGALPDTIPSLAASAAAAAHVLFAKNEDETEA